MAIRRGTPLPWLPLGVSDTQDSTTAPAGAMRALTNLIPDPTTLRNFVCRPASILDVDFERTGGAFSSAFSSAFDTGLTSGTAFISAMLVVGTRIFGMVASKNYPGFDQPFCYDKDTQTIIAISGITGVNLPAAASSSGEWVPPTMDLVGTSILVTHPGFTGAGGLFFGTIGISDPSALTWTAGNTTTTALPTPPTAVKQFNNRAWFLVNPSTGQPAAYYSDILVPGTITNANQIVTFGDNRRLTALGALPLNNQLGGIVQALMVFKGASNIYQITGDAASSTLAMNTLNVATGTDAPLSICPTNKGLAFAAPDGVRFIDFQANVSDPIGISGQGVTVPFTYCVVPSRMCAAFNSGVLRISTQNGYAPGNPQQEWWYDVSRTLWTGPHSFPASLIQPYESTFVMTPIGVTNKIFQSDVVQSATSTFVENDEQMTFTFLTPKLPNTGQMAQNAIIETTVDMALGAGAVVSVQALDTQASVISSVIIEASATATLWGQFQWGQAQWGGAQDALRPRRVDWTKPLVSAQFYMLVTGNCAQGNQVGKVYLRYEVLGYLAA